MFPSPLCEQPCGALNRGAFKYICWQENDTRLERPGQELETTALQARSPRQPSKCKEKKQQSRTRKHRRETAVERNNPFLIQVRNSLFQQF